jgi:hypothetical protein
MPEQPDNTASRDPLHARAAYEAAYDFKKAFSYFRIAFFSCTSIYSLFLCLTNIKNIIELVELEDNFKLYTFV